MKEDPGATRKKAITSVKAKVQATDKEAHLLYCTSLVKQVQIVQSSQGRYTRKPVL